MLLRIVPTVIVAWLLYHLVFLMEYSSFQNDAAATLNAPLLSIGLLNGGSWPVSAGDLITTVTVLTGFFEVTKSASLRRLHFLDHAFAMLFFSLAMIEFLYYKPAQTSVFFFILLAVLLDVIVGYFVGIRSARRDIAVDAGL